MYPIESNNWNGNTCLKCITGENGITIVDLQIDDQKSKRFDGWFINIEDQVIDRFEKFVFARTL